MTTSGLPAYPHIIDTGMQVTINTLLTLHLHLIWLFI